MRGRADITRFAGVRVPSSDFEAVNNGLLIQYEFTEIDLTNARSIAAGTQLEVPYEGNVIYADQNADVGNCTIIFQDTAKSLSKPARLYVQPGSNFQIPFTRFMLENTAQAGKVMRLFYGVDIEFKPGNTNNVQISGTVNVAETGSSYGASYKSTTGLAANTPDTVVAPGTNVNGLKVWKARWANRSATVAGFLAKASAPATVIDGDVIVGTNMDQYSSGGSASSSGWLDTPVIIPAGKGLYFISTTLEAEAYRSVLYTVL